MSAQASLLDKAGGDRTIALQSLLADDDQWKGSTHLRARLGSTDPAVRAAAEAEANRRETTSTKGKSHGVFKTLGSVLKVAAPVAALAIPGLGPVVAGAIAAGGSAAGGALHGDKFSLGKTLMAGAGGAAGSALLGGKGINGLSGLASKATAKTGVLSKALDYAKKNPLKTAQIGMAGLSAVHGASRQGAADQQLGRSLSAVTPRPSVNLTDMFRDNGNPYQSATGVPNQAARAARYSLSGGY